MGKSTYRVQFNRPRKLKYKIKSEIPNCYYEVLDLTKFSILSTPKAITALSSFEFLVYFNPAKLNQAINLVLSAPSEALSPSLPFSASYKSHPHMASVKTEGVSSNMNTPFVRKYAHPERVPAGNGVSAVNSKEAWIKAEQAKEERARVRQMERERFRNQQERIKMQQKREWDIKVDSEVERNVTGRIPSEEAGFASNPWTKWTTPPPGM